VLTYPAIDLKDGVCVRLLQGRFDAVTAYDADPFARLKAFEADGAAWVHIVDLDGARAGRPVQHELIGRLAASTPVRIQTGGGVRERADVERLLKAGAARVVVGSAAVRRPAEVRDWIGEFGAERICVALDARPDQGGFRIVVDGWASDSPFTLAAALDLFGEGELRHVLVTDISRDGAMSGPNLELIGAIAARRPDLRVQASGGVRDLADIRALDAAGAAGVIVGRAIYEGRVVLREAVDAG
jgi:phosphoribosylformimino-5-aminoimidazole carboxamide ribotide isomerase